MNWYSQLTRLVLDFYRENPVERRKLSGLQACRLSRWWGVFRINCRDSRTASSVIDAIDLLREPIARLRLAQQIKVMVNGKSVATFPVEVAKFDQKPYGKPQV